MARPTIHNCILAGNSAVQGGGLANVAGDPLIVRTRISQNASIGDGGGLYNVDGYYSIINSELRGNTAGGLGGAIYNFSCSFGDGPGPRLINCLIVENTAAGSGGGIASIESCFTYLAHCTVAANVAASGGAVFHAELSGLLVADSIFWSNAPDAIDSSMNYAGGQVWYSDVENGFAGTGNIDADPLFVDAAAGNYRLSADSLAVDAANPTGLHGDEADLDGDGVTSEPLPLDLDGEPRVQGPQADMGAYERGVPPAPIPAASAWALAVMALMLLSLGTAVMRRSSDA